MPAIKPAAEIPLVPLEDFKTAVKKVLAHSKKESDKQMADLRTSNKKREHKK